MPQISRQKRIVPEDIPVTSATIEAGLEVLEETDERPLSRLTVERAFQAMCLCALTEYSSESLHQR